MKIKFIFFTLFLISGCLPYRPYYSGYSGAQPIASQVPVPSAYQISTQQKMQAMHHWKLLAEDVAFNIKKNIENKGLQVHQNSYYKHIYVTPFGSTPFEKAFRELIITKLVEIGTSVSDDLSDSLVLSVETQMITHNRKILKTNAGVYKSLAPGFYVRRDVPLSGRENQRGEAERNVGSAQLNVEAGAYTIELPENEIMVTASLTVKGDYIVRYCAMYYIDDPEQWHYKYQSPKSHRSTVVNYNIVSD